MPVVSYKNPQLSNISITTPLKKNVFTSYVIYDNESSYSFQTPILDIDAHGNNFSFKLHRNNNFVVFLDKLHDRIKDIIFKNSKKFFKDKVFTEDKINKSISKMYSINDDCNTVVLNNIKLSQRSTLYKGNTLQTEIQNEKFKAYSIIEISDITFIKSIIYINLEVLQLKIKENIDNKHMTSSLEDCVLDDPKDEVTSIPVEEVSEAIIGLNEKIEDIIVEEDEELLEEIIEDSENDEDDNKDSENDEDEISCDEPDISSESSDDSFF